MKSAVIETEPRATGIHEHAAVVDSAVAEVQPLMDVPPNLKFTDPGLETVAVIVTAPLRAAVEDEPGRAIVIDEDAFATVMVICFNPD